MRTNYNESSGRNGRYSKRQNSGGSNNGRRSSGRRPNNSGGGGSANIPGMTSKRNKYLDMAKEALSNGNRVEAENYYQHAEHYSKMLSAAAATKREREEALESSNRRHNNEAPQKEKQVPDAKKEDAPAQPPKQIQQEAVPSENPAQ